MLNTTTSLDQKNRGKKEKKVREKKREKKNKVIVAAICLQCNNYLENEKCPSIVII